MEIGDRIKEVRISLGLTQQQLAERSGLAAITIRQYENKKRIPRVEQLSKLAKAMGVSLSYLCIGKERSNRYAYQTLHPSFDPEFLPEYLKKIKLNLEQNNIAVLIDAMDRLNEKGKEIAIERIQELAEIPRYRADNATDQGHQPADASDDKDPAGE